jgi:hypothetical protein
MVTDFRRHAGETSIRQYAREHGTSFETLRYWLKRYDQISAASEVKAFFESPAGIAFLHLLLIALHVCFTKVGAASIRNITSFLQYVGLDQFTASSVSHQHTLNKQIDEQICAYGEEETQRMAAEMPERLICVAEDETFHPNKMCLVVIEPVSNYIVLECYAEKRDSQTWTRLVTQALEGLQVKVVWQTSDEAKGLRHHSTVGLEAHHAPDLFHIQQELVKGTSRVLTAQRVKAEKKHRVLMAKSLQPIAGRGGQLRFETHSKLQYQQLEAGMELALAHIRRYRVKKARRSISDAYHPYDIFTGEPQTAQTVASKLELAFKDIATATTHLGESCDKRIAKAKRLVPEITATITQFFSIISLIVNQATQSEILHRQLISVLIPGYYLLEAARKDKSGKRRQTITEKALALLRPFHQRAGPFANLEDGEIAHLEKVARECAGLFQRSSSCVEGRNAHLARYHRGFHRLSDLRLSALTVVHNFLIQRSDGTTAAQRFFQKEHGDLFQWLVNHIDLPSRPHNRKKKTSAKAV